LSDGECCQLSGWKALITQSNSVTVKLLQEEEEEEDLDHRNTSYIG